MKRRKYTRKGQCPICTVSTGSLHKMSCDYAYNPMTDSNRVQRPRESIQAIVQALNTYRNESSKYQIAHKEDIEALVLDLVFLHPDENEFIQAMEGIIFTSRMLYLCCTRLNYE